MGFFDSISEFAAIGGTMGEVNQDKQAKSAKQDEPIALYDGDIGELVESIVNTSGLEIREGVAETKITAESLVRDLKNQIVLKPDGTIVFGAPWKAGTRILFCDLYELAMKYAKLKRLVFNELYEPNGEPKPADETSFIKGMLKDENSAISGEVKSAVEQLSGIDPSKVADEIISINGIYLGQSSKKEMVSAIEQFAKSNAEFYSSVMGQVSKKPEPKDNGSLPEVKLAVAKVAQTGLKAMKTLLNATEKLEEIIEKQPRNPFANEPEASQEAEPTDSADDQAEETSKSKYADDEVLKNFG